MTGKDNKIQATIKSQSKENLPRLRDLLDEHITENTIVNLFSLEPVLFPSDRYTAVQSLEVNVISSLTKNQGLYHQLFTETKKQ